MARQVLGRGLSALLGEENTKTTGEELLDLFLLLFLLVIGFAEEFHIWS